jgi:hypothetical protein
LYTVTIRAFVDRGQQIEVSWQHNGGIRHVIPCKTARKIKALLLILPEAGEVLATACEKQAASPDKRNPVGSDKRIIELPDLTHLMHFRTIHELSLLP